MKKYAAILLTGVLVFSLTACGSATEQTQVQPQSTVSDAPEAAENSEAESTQVNEVETETVENQPTETEADTTEAEGTETLSTEAAESTEVMEEADGGNVLVAYFSWSGNTAQLAQMIQSETGADLFEIAPQTPYTEDYDTLLDVAQQEQRDNARPALASHVDNWEDYSTVFVGYPNWWGDAPMIILSFLEAYDCTGKTIVPFCTSGGGGFGGSLSNIANSAAGATVAEGLHVSGSSVGSAAENVASWVAELQLTE